MQFAFWNNGSPRVLRTLKNVALPSGTTVADVVAPIPEQDLYRYEEVPAAPAAHQRPGALVFARDGDTITATWSLEDRPLEELRAEKLAALAAHRYAAETGGLVLTDGTRIGTDRQDQAMITGTLLGFMAGAIAEVRWKTGGSFLTLDAAAFQPIAAAVAAHVEASFAREAEHAAAIEALATAAAVAAYDVTTGWPEAA